MRKTSALKQSQSGFTLIELMVGALLGMLTVIVIAQVLAQAEGNRRTLSSGGDAEVNGALATFGLQRDIQMAGYGISSEPAALGCEVNAKYDSGGTPFSFTLAPVQIVNGSGTAPDEIIVTYASTQTSSVPIKVTENHPQTQGYFIVSTALGIRPGDQLIAVPETVSSTNKCTLFAATHDATAPETTLGLTRIPHTSTNKWNQSVLFPVGGYPVNSYLINVGRLIHKTYSVNSNNALEVEILSSTNGAPSTTDAFSNVVNLQALYGKDTNNDGSVDAYTATSPTSTVEWGQVLNIKLAIVTRSSNYEKEEVTQASPLWDYGSNIDPTGETLVTCHGTRKCITLNVSGLTDWKHYRYKVYSNTIPLRNVLWNS
ncbi:MAG: PilW family protein [Aquabacterium sp.]